MTDPTGGQGGGQATPAPQPAPAAAATPAPAATTPEGGGQPAAPTIENPQGLLNAHERVKSENTEMKGQIKALEDQVAQSTALMEGLKKLTGQEQELTPELVAAKDQQLKAASDRLAAFEASAKAEVEQILEGNDQLKTVIREDWPVEEQLRVLKATVALTGGQAPAPGSAPSTTPSQGGGEIRTFKPGDLPKLPSREFEIVDRAIRKNGLKTNADGSISVNMAGVS